MMARVKPPRQIIKPLCAHHVPEDQMPAVTAAERRARGEKQIKCKRCNRWLWPDQLTRAIEWRKQ